MIIFQFHRTNTPLGKAIRFFSGGMVNHTSTRIGDYVWEAIFSIKINGFKIKIISEVVKTHISDWHKENQVVVSYYYNISKSEERHIIKWQDKQVGKKYDFRGVLSFIFPRLKEKKGLWFCSEKDTVVFAKIQGLPSGTYNKRQAPQNLLDIIQFNENK